MGLLSASQITRIKQIRPQKPFTVLRTSLVPTEDFYDEPTTDLPDLILSGNWVWQDMISFRTGVGGESTQGQLTLITDLANESLLLQSGTRLKVDDIVCAIHRVQRAEMTEQLLVRASQVQ